MKKYNVAVVGATGNVGRKLISILDERNFPVEDLYALASKNSLHKKISFGDEKILSVQQLDNFDFTKVDLVLSCVNSNITKSYIDKAIKANCTIIDKSSLFRNDPDVALVVPEVNEHEILRAQNKKIIASPNCCVIPLVTILSPLHQDFKIKRIVISTYQSVSGAGRAHMDELYNQTKSTYMPEKLHPEKFDKQIAFNILPKIDDIESNGNTVEEQKIISETKKILGADIGVSVTAVRVPVFVSHALSVNVEFTKPFDLEEIFEILQETESVAIVRDDSELKYITPVEVTGEDLVYVARVRKDDSTQNALSLWICADNLRKGAALNAVQIAEKLYKV
ncbi:MAG: aspartate-semialdehyde dehydrogenase [Rickettsiaceae bacterium]|nr:aspartate-semialdehyde dehydrogenase [Rickettsiaceae bacterium]